MGIDPSPEMINIAREMGGTTMSGNQIQFLIETAEKCAGPKEVQGGVDLLVAAMAVCMATFFYSVQEAFVHILSNIDR